jgi:hypothetical protein
VRLVFQVLEEAQGRLYVRDLPKGREWVIWRWGEDKTGLPGVYYDVSPDQQKAILVEAHWSYSATSTECNYIFVLLDLTNPDVPARRLPLGQEVAYIVYYPQWISNSAFVFGVSSKVNSEDNYRELIWEADFSGQPRPSGKTSEYFNKRSLQILEQTRQALKHIPKNLVPEDIEQSSRLITAADCDDVTLHRFEVAVRSCLSLAPSGKRFAVTNLGRSLTVVDLHGGKIQAIRPMAILAGEITQLEQLRWSPDEKWLLFTERHYQKYKTPPGVAHQDSWSQTVAFVRAFSLQSGQGFTLVAGENAFWIKHAAQ